MVIGGFVAQTFVRGLPITFIVVASIELLEMGDSGVGLLNAAFGLGGLIGAIAALGLRAGPRLGVVFVIALAGWGLPLALIGAWPAAAVALAALFVAGMSNAMLDVSGFTLVQRGVRNEDRVTVFGLMGDYSASGCYRKPAGTRPSLLRGDENRFRGGRSGAADRRARHLATGHERRACGSHDRRSRCAPSAQRAFCAPAADGTRPARREHGAALVRHRRRAHAEGRARGPLPPDRRRRG